MQEWQNRNHWWLTSEFIGGFMGEVTANINNNANNNDDNDDDDDDDKCDNNNN